MSAEIIPWYEGAEHLFDQTIPQREMWRIADRGPAAVLVRIDTGAGVGHVLIDVVSDRLGRDVEMLAFQGYGIVIDVDAFMSEVARGLDCDGVRAFSSRRGWGRVLPGLGWSVAGELWRRRV